MISSLDNNSKTLFSSNGIQYLPKARGCQLLNNSLGFVFSILRPESPLLPSLTLLESLWLDDVNGPCGINWKVASVKGRDCMPELVRLIGPAWVVEELPKVGGPVWRPWVVVMLTVSAPPPKLFPTPLKVKF